MNGRRTSDIKEEGGTGAAVASDPIEMKPLSLSEIAGFQSEVNRKASELAAIQACEERRKKAREEVEMIALMTGHKGDTASEMASTSKRPSVPQKPHTGRNEAFDALSFDDILAMSDEQIQAMNA
ncbi:hypothetical protein [Peribacillus butanolivorans]|uniref:hypothetical protein n=1 Tax=Peribacillus butanolivorans TaxID=421767 RepID=UPI0036DA7C51